MGFIHHQQAEVRELQIACLTAAEAAEVTVTKRLGFFGINSRKGWGYLNCSMGSFPGNAEHRQEQVVWKIYTTSVRPFLQISGV